MRPGRNETGPKSRTGRNEPVPFVCIRVYSCIFVCLRVYSCVFVCIRVYSCVFVCIRVSSCIFVCIREYSFKLETRNGNFEIRN